MVSKMDKFNCLSEEDRIRDILEILENGYYSLAITLTSGDILFGDQSFDLVNQYLPYSESYRDRKDYEILRKSEKPISDHIVIIFPDGSGTVYGHSYAVRIPVALIARIQGITPFIDEGPERALKNSPNPLSTSIKIHNYQIIKKLGLRWCSYVEEALSKKAISGKNIKFEKYELVYADWDYFKNINGGIRNLGGNVCGFGISVGVARSNSELVLSKLYENTNYKGIIREDPDKQDFSLEGDTVRVYDLKISGETPYRSIPLLIKDEYLSYPKEYISHIDSELTIFGESRQIPFYLNGNKYDLCLLARAIAFVPYRSDTP